ncbi:hypothetical protein niasHT_026250 [Heterodera trifolii]|uniref:Uncharacterized protein n=1 Tax=Heterodera trifolii TaxID=157864 RepID=A0ABD2JC26_9BILA
MRNLSSHIRSQHWDDTPFNVNLATLERCFLPQSKTRKLGAGVFSSTTSATDNTWSGFLHAYGAADHVLHLVDNDYLDHNDLFCMCRRKEIDGCSGSGTVFCSIYSLATGRLCRSNTAVTAWVERIASI